MLVQHKGFIEIIYMQDETPAQVERYLAQTNNAAEERKHLGLGGRNLKSIRIPRGFPAVLEHPPT